MILLLIALGPAGPSAVAEELVDVSHAYTLRENFMNRGLSSRNITQLMQDSRGYMWIGTNNWLNRFDGYDFTVYAPDPRSSNTLNGSGITGLFESEDGLIWIGTADGNLNCYDRRTGTFNRFDIKLNSKSGPGKKTITFFANAGDGNLWMATSKWQILHFNTSTGVCRSLAELAKQAPKKHVESYRCRMFLTDSQGRLFYYTEDGMARFSPADSSVAIVQPLLKLDATMFGFLEMHRHNDDEFFLCLTHSYARYNARTNQLEYLYHNAVRDSLGPHQYIGMANNGNQQLWLLRANQSIIMHDLQSGERTLVYAGIKDEPILVPNSMRIFADRSGTIWLGWRNGLAHIHRHSLDFERVSTAGNYGLEQRPQVWYLRSIFIDSHGTEWLGADLGIYHRKKDSSQFVRGIPGDPDFPTAHSINVIREDSSGYLWFGSSNTHTVAWHPLNDSIISFASKDSDSLPARLAGIYSAYIDPAGDIWLGSSMDLCLYQHSSGEVQKFRPEDRMSDGGRSFTFSMAERGGDDSLWIGSNDGIRVFDRGEKAFVNVYSSNSEYATSVSNNAVWSLLFSDRNTLWAGTYGHGLNRLNLTNQEFSLYTDQDGLSNNVIYGIMQDQRGYLWLSTDKGLSRFDLRSTQFKNYDQMDGLWSNENYFGAYLHHKPSGQMFVGGLRGYSAFNPDSVLTNTTSPPMLLTEIRIMDKPINRELLNGDTLQLDWRDNFVSFRFASVDYSNPSKHQYAYMLEGVDRDWVYSGSRRLAAYTELAGGTYTFRIKGTNSDRIWNDENFAIVVDIRPEPWTTLEFRIALLLLICTLVFLIARSRYKRAQQRAEVKRKLLERELEALRMQMNPHFLFNSLTSVQHFIMRNHPDTARDYIARFARLMRMVVETGNKERISLSEELNILDTYLKLERERFQQRLQYKIQVDSNVNPDEISIPPMLLQPFVENAVVHGLQQRHGEGTININVQRRQNQIVYTIEDDGVGRKSAAQRGAESRSAGTKHESMGIHVTDKRIEMLNEALREQMHVDITDLFDKNNKAIGTRVELFLPVMIHSS